VPISNQIWQDAVMDFITGLPLSHGHSVILVIINPLSKFAYFSPLTSYFSAPKVIEVFLKTIMSAHDIPQTSVSYHDKIFTNKFWEQISNQQGIKLARNSTYHPQSNGQIKVLNHYLEMYLRCYTQANPKDWYTLLP